jgi:hypothetical protein
MPREMTYEFEGPQKKQAKRKRDDYLAAVVAKIDSRLSSVFVERAKVGTLALKPARQLAEKKAQELR